MKYLFAFMVLLATGLATGYHDLPNALSLSSRQIHTTPRSTSSQTSKPSVESRIFKRSTCTGEHCLLPRKSTSPSPPRDRGSNNNSNNNNHNRASTLGNPRNRHNRQGVTVPVMSASALMHANSGNQPPAGLGNGLAPPNPGTHHNRASTPVPASTQPLINGQPIHPSNQHQRLPLWRGNPHALPLRPDMHPGPPLPMELHVGMFGRHTDYGPGSTPREPIIFGQGLSAFRALHR